MVLLVPYTIRMLGMDLFGLWTLIFSTVGFFGLLDLGFATSVVKYVAEHQGNNNSQQRNEILSTIMAVYLILSVIGFAGIAGFSVVFDSIFDIPESSRSVSNAVLWLIALRSIVLQFPLGLYRGILFGNQRIFIINIIQIVTQAGYGAGTWQIGRAHV